MSPSPNAASPNTASPSGATTPVVSYQTEESDPYCLSPASAAELLAGAPWHRFGVIGDSLSAGTGDPSPGYATLGWADRVADVLRRVRPTLAYRNTAEIGSTSAQTLATQADPMREFAPDLLHLPSGANDLFVREPDFAHIERTLRRLYEFGAGTGAQLTVFALGRAFVLPKFPDWTDRVRTLNDLTRRLAAEHGALVVDIWDHPLNSRPDLLSADRIHFAMSGHAVLAAETVRGLAGLLADRR